MKALILGLIAYVAIFCGVYYLGYIPGFETISEYGTIGIFGLTTVVFGIWTLIVFYNSIREWIKHR